MQHCIAREIALVTSPPRGTVTSWWSTEAILMRHVISRPRAPPPRAARAGPSTSGRRRPRPAEEVHPESSSSRACVGARVVASDLRRTGTTPFALSITCTQSSSSAVCARIIQSVAQRTCGVERTVCRCVESEQWVANTRRVTAAPAGRSPSARSRARPRARRRRRARSRRRARRATRRAR
jgi:hypothetical protein